MEHYKRHCMSIWHEWVKKHSYSSVLKDRYLSTENHKSRFGHKLKIISALQCRNCKNLHTLKFMT